MRVLILMLMFIIGDLAVAGSHIYQPLKGPVNEIHSDRHSNYCALDANNLITCWSAWNYPTHLPPQNLGPVKSVSVGGQNTCAIREDFSVVCWGTPNTHEGTVYLPPQLQYARSISLQDDRGCGISLSGIAYCWRTSDLADEGEPPEYVHYLRQLPRHYNGYDEIHVYINGACMTRENGQANCWNERLYQFHLVPPKENVSKISIDDWATGCALMKSGSIECFGSDYDGTFDQDGKVDPVPADLGQARDMALGRVNACAVSEQGLIKCWSMCTLQSCFYDGVSTPPTNKALKLAIGIENGCAIMEDHSVTCWETPEERRAIR